ncbi:dynamin family protein [Seohaeicola zhoushanensis]|uniref:Dynamin family protein n=2 Tax=Seohaeicola zhoushanensis TaxID=1569283 RepID=A0A8J3GZY7_9RHOB|nr:dynamin family protein [Seohaeicola zhoushanensis]
MKMETNLESATQLRAPAAPCNLGAGLEGMVEFAERVEHLDRTLESLCSVTGESTSRSVDRLRKSLADYEPTVTILGQVKAGKTALVNAMAGWADLLPSDVNPWTSVVTSLHLTPGRKRAEIGARFKFMTEREWDRLLTKGGRIGELAGRAGAESELEKIREQIETMREKSRKRLGKKFELLLGQEHEYGFFDKNLVERYICLGDDFDVEGEEGGPEDQGRFADITRSADLYMNSPTVPFRMCLRDTPGVNDTFMMREQVTIQAIRESRICVVVLSAHQALTSVDMGLIRLISNLKSRDVLIFVNRIDELADPQNQIPEIEASIRQTLVDQNGPTGAAIIFGSAYWANKVLSGGIETMSELSSHALLDWAATALDDSATASSPADMVWELSGLPNLFRHLSERIVADSGEAILSKIANSAVTIASSQKVAESITIEGKDAPEELSMYDVRSRFDHLADRHLTKLGQDFDAMIAEYQTRADRAHANFIERATHSLVEHLERHGEREVWEYSPTGLRMLLRSAYNVFGTRAHALAVKSFEAAVTDLAELYYAAFGSVVGGIQIGLPMAPEIPSPVALGQTIALDFRDGWWKSWWRRTRGYKAFAQKFQLLIAAETEDFMHQLKVVQTAEVKDAALRALHDFMEEQKDILLELGSHAGGVTDVQELFLDRSELERRGALQDALDTLTRYAA